MIGFQQLSTWVEINLKGIRDNVDYIRNHTGVNVMAIVKANGYGHGAVPVARAALQGGASWCGVARIEEALELRHAGLNCPILIMGYIPQDMVEEAITANISFTVWNRQQIDTAARAAQKHQVSARLHVKVDTGMRRLGVESEGAADLVFYLTKKSGVVFEGIFTHFACADEANPEPTNQQENRFRKVVADIHALGFEPAVIHAANSAASLTRPSSFFNLVRFGIAMYGLHPSSTCLVPREMTAVLTWKSSLSQVKTVPTGSGISYGHEYKTRGDEIIGTVPVGYADGYRRASGNIVLVRGKRVPVIGRVCMDQIMVQLNQIPDAQTGDEVVLIGTQGEETIPAEEVAKSWNTINYEVVCGIGQRVQRIYLGA